MSGFLVDTNVWSETLRKQADGRVVEWLRHHESELYMSAITVGEIKSGVDQLPKGKRRSAYQDWLNGLRKRMDGRILSFNTSVAIAWGQLLARCRAKGITLPTIDSQLAATAQHHSLVIATRNQDDFKNAEIKSVNPFAG